MHIVPPRARPKPWNLRIRHGALGGAFGTLVGALVWSWGGLWWLGTLAGILLALFPLPTDPPVLR